MAAIAIMKECKFMAGKGKGTKRYSQGKDRTRYTRFTKSCCNHSGHGKSI